MLCTKTLYNTKVKIYPNGQKKITVFSKAVFNPENWEEVEKVVTDRYGNTNILSNNLQITSLYSRDYTETGNRLDSLKRGKEKVFDIAFINLDLWKYMITFTLDKEKIDRFDTGKILPKFQQWLKDSSKRKGLNYLLVAEYHKDGAIHFHGLLSDGLNYKDSGLIDSFNRPIYDVLDYPFGFARAVPIDEGTQEMCCKYITKYFTKDFQKIFGKFYWCGGKKIQRNCFVEYYNSDFNEYIAQSFDVPNANMQVKYLTESIVL